MGNDASSMKDNAMISQKKSELMIYVDESQKAHYAYLISFFVKPEQGLPAAPIFIMDAETFELYKQWDNIQTAQIDAEGGGLPAGAGSCTA